MAPDVESSEWTNLNCTDTPTHALNIGRNKPDLPDHFHHPCKLLLVYMCRPFGKIRIVSYISLLRWNLLCADVAPPPTTHLATCCAVPYFHSSAANHGSIAFVELTLTIVVPNYAAAS